MPVKLPRFKTLAARFLLIYAISVGLTIATLGVYQYLIVRQDLYRQAEQSDANVIFVLQEMLSEHPDILTSDRLSLVLGELSANVPGLDRISIVDTSFRIIADTAPAEIGQFTDQSALIQVLQTLEGTSFTYSRGGANFFRLHRALHELNLQTGQDEVFGAVTIDMALAPVDAEVAQSFWQIMTILTLLVVATALPMFGLIYNGLIRPVLSLARVADRIADGELETPMPPARADEIGRLAASFANMVARLKSLLAGLEIRVAERTQALEASHQQLSDAYQALQDNQQKLLLAEKMASLGRLTAGIAHEMNTPLAAVRAAMTHLTRLITEYQASAADPDITLADHHAIAADMTATMQLADTAAERAAGFVRGIKAQTRDLGLQQAVRFDAVVVVDEALLLLGHALAAAGHRVTFEHGPAPVYLSGSPGRLAQVVTNLVTNAIESMPAPGGKVSLRLTHTADEVRLEVGDTGSGIAADVLPHIFDPLFTTKGLAHGTGLGMTIVHDVVTGDFGGSIAVQTQVGAGTTMTIHLPNGKEH